MKRFNSGFTVIELIVAIVFITIVASLVIMQQASLAASSRDTSRKTAINAMYYSLEDAFHQQKGYYPEKIDSSNLTSMDPALFVDPNGVKLGDASSNYRYETINCTNGRCTGYTLRADLEKEADYIKTSRNK
jgi:general secretion pathway protein G